MARTKGTANLSGTIEPLAGGALDARSVVQTKADLTAINSFPYSYIGMETYVVAENKKYRLIGSDPTVLSNWEKEGGSADVTVYTPGGSLTFENLPVLSGSVLGYVYNVTNDFVTTSDFVEGAGKHCPAGTNVAVVAAGTSSSPVYKFDASTVMIDLDDYQKKFQFAAMPTASEDLEGVILQYIGETTPDYTNGYFYKCVEGSTSGTYSWIEANSNYVKKSGDTMTGGLTTPDLTVGSRSTGNKGLYSSTIGNGNVASGQSSLAVGLNNTVEELGAFAQGNANTVTGAESFASGAHNNVSGELSSAIGLYNTVSGDKATAIGSNLNVGYDYQVSIGTYNDNNEDNVFEIGHGYGNSSRYNIFEVRSSGDVNVSGNITSGGEITDGEGNVLSEKQDEITGAATSIVDTDLDSDVVLISDSNGKVSDSDVSATELGYLSGVTDYIQDQLDGKADASDLEDKQDIFQYDTMPTASDDNVGDIVQFTGTTTASYTNGYFYKCEETIVDGGDPVELPYNFNQGSAVVYDDKIHILGCNSLSYDKKHYSFNGSEWVEESQLPISLFASSVVVYNNEIHILGTGGSTDNKKHYKWNGASWTEVSTLPDGNFNYKTAVVYNNEIYILRSNTSGSTYNTKLYKWDGTTWTQVSSLPYNSVPSNAVVYNNEIHVLGSLTSNYPKRHYKWDGSAWSEVSTLPINFDQGSAVVYNDEIHILGSQNSSNAHYKWDGTSWTSASTLPYSFYYGSAIVYKNEINILGSASSNNGKKHYKWDGTEWAQNTGKTYGYGWVQTNVQPSGGSGGDAETTEDITSNIEVGGIPSGALIPTGTTLTAFVKKLLVKETAPTITVNSSASSVIEVGKSFGPTLTLNITGTGTGTPTSIKFYSGSTLTDTQAYVEGTNTYTYKYVDTTITTAMSITLKAVLEYTKSDGTSGTVEKSITHTFVYASYSGVVTTAPTTISEIRDLTKNVKSGKGFTTTFNLSNQKACYCYPASMGNLTSIKDANNFEYISSYTKTTVDGSSSGFTNYNVYTLTDPVTASGFKQVYA